MFVKLSQRSTSWWICVAITGVFASILLTVVAYPTYAALCAGICTDDHTCGPLPFCSSCNTGLNGGAFTHKAEVEAFRIWPSHNSNDCFGEVNTYHSVEATNLSAQERELTVKYKSLVIIKSGYAVDCEPTDPSLNLPGLPEGTWKGSFTIPVGETRKHSRSQTVIWKLGAQGNECTYEAQTVTQVDYGDNAGSADVQCPEDTEPELAGCE